MTLSPSFHLDGGGGGGGGVSSSTCSGATGAAAGGGGRRGRGGVGLVGARRGGPRRRGAGRVATGGATGGFQLAGEAVWGESIFISGKRLPESVVWLSAVCRNPDAMCAVAEVCGCNRPPFATQNCERLAR